MPRQYLEIFSTVLKIRSAIGINMIYNLYSNIAKNAHWQFFLAPLWFCKYLHQPATDDLEIRLCNYHDICIQENKIISL